MVSYYSKKIGWEHMRQLVRTALFSYIVLFSTSLASTAWALDCTKLTPVDCYTQGLKQVQEALGAFESLRSEVAKLRDELSNARGEIVILKTVGKARVLNSPTENSSRAAGNSAETNLAIGPYPAKAIVFVSGWGGSDLTTGGVAARAGISFAITRDGSVLASSDSYESQSYVMNFRASASYIFILEPNTAATIRAGVSPQDTGGQKNTGTQVHLSVVAIESF